MANGFLMRSVAFTPSPPGGLAAGTSALYIANDYMGMVMRGGSANSNVGCVIDLGAAVSIDTIVLLNVVQGAGALAVQLFGSNDSSFATYGYNANIPLDAAEVLSSTGRRQVLHLLASAVSYRYWLLRLPAQAGVTGEIARCLIGTRSPYARNFSYGVQRGAEDLGDIEHSPRGATLRRRGRKLRTLGLAWQFVSQAEAEGFALPLLEEVGNTEYVLACLNPDADPQRSRRMYYGNLTGDLGLTWRNHDGWEKRLQMQSVI